MKSLILFLITTTTVFSQVGINTTTPTETLDVNGSLRIRTTETAIEPETISSGVLAVENEVVKTISSKDILESAIPGIAKGTFSSTGTINISLLSGNTIIPFDMEDIDSGNEFDTATSTFTAAQDGIYEVNVQIVVEATLSAATSLGVRILKNNTLLHENSFANVKVLSINVTPPTRQLNTIISLEQGDTIHFEIKADIALGSVNLVGASSKNFFSIVQIR